MKINIHHLSKFTSLILLFLISFAGTTLNAQSNIFNMHDLGSETYLFKTELPTADLEFYLFGDGHYSLEKTPTHQFESVSNAETPKIYHTPPYSGHDVDFYIYPNTPTGVTATNDPPKATENMVELKTSWNLVENQDHYHILTFENTTSTTPISGCVEFHFNDQSLSIDSNQVKDNYGNGWVGNKNISESEYLLNGYNQSFSWPFQNLAFGEQRFIYIPADCNLQAMQRVFTMAVMKIDGCESSLPYSNESDGAFSNNTNNPFYTQMSMVSNHPKDPNCITTNPEVLSLSDIEQTVRYRIYFHNEGRDPVINVFLYLNLDSPYEAVTLIEASHNCEAEVIGNEIQVKFKNALIQGMRQTNPVPLYEETIGWVDLDICFDLARFTNLGVNGVESQVAIIFDNEQPVYAFNRIIRGLSTTSIPYAYCPANPIRKQYYTMPSPRGKSEDIKKKASIVPNPGRDIVRIENVNFDEVISLKVFSSQGQAISLNTSRSIKDGNLDIKDLIPGVYYLKITSLSTTQTVTFVKL